MPAAFTHYWQREKLMPGDEPRYCSQAFSTQFVERGVSAGDRVFFVSYYGKRPYLVGAITAVTNPVVLENGAERVDAVPGSGSIIDFDRAIPLEVARAIIRLPSGEGLKFAAEDVLDSQTLRGVQRISAASAELLDGLLGVTGGDYTDDELVYEVEMVEDGLYPDEVAVSQGYTEGAVAQVVVNRYERDPDARRACLEHYGFSCVVCEIDLSAFYGELGAGFIHVHHVTPISELGQDYAIDPVKDLVPVCPNCHAMLHRKSPPMSVEELREIYEAHTSALLEE
ncbi:MAG: HNH endonuclease [Verrucomicrobiaceae bacterium]|nr:HNH endonuclease [Verrucomicrobiaceae bacterium]